MAKSVLELAVNSGKWDAGLRKAKNALDNFTEAHGGLSKALANESDKMRQFVQMMGKTSSNARTAKGQLNDYKSAIEQLTMQYNRMDSAQKATIGRDYLNAIDQIKQKYRGVSEEIKKINEELGKTPDKGSGAGGLLGGKMSGLFGGSKMSGMLQVFGGNLMAKGAGAAMGALGEMKDMVAQGIELARQGEGVRLAFERLNQPGLLDNLRAATHGTVTDLELMKAAVKFSDFKLPLEELGSMLAFAQQKAKDTGQSVDYMTDSIVTGLGRKSVLILDNLGISAAEIKDRMKETGDMTKAVGAIIREQMSKAGEYIETSADKATQANVELENAMTRLGATFQPLANTASSMWNDIKVGALDLLNNAVRPLIQALAEAGALGTGARVASGYNNLGGGSKVDRMIGRLGNGKTAGAYNIYQKQLKEFDKYINNKRFQIAAFGGDNSGIAQSAKQRLQTEIDGALKMRAEYVKRAQELHNKVPSPYEPAKTSGGATGGGGGGGGSTFSASSITFNPAAAAGAAAKGIAPQATSVWAMLGGGSKDDKGLRQMMGIGPEQKDFGRALKEAFESESPEEKSEDRDFRNGFADITSGVSNMVSTLETLGLEVPEGLKQTLGVLQVMTGVVNSIYGAVMLIKSINTIGAFLGLAGGGVVHAAGGFVPGNSYSGDRIPAMLNAGEIVLNQAETSMLATKLQGGGLSNLHLEATLHGEDIKIALRNNGKRTGESINLKFK